MKIVMVMSKFERDSIIQMNCKQGKQESVEYYRVLSFFMNYYNKCYIAEG